MRRGILIFSFIFLLGQQSLAKDSASIKPKILVWSGLGIASTGIHLALYKTWFSDYPMSGFRWINDNNGWMQMDKIGHAWTAHFITSGSAQLFQMAGYNRKKSAVFGAAVSTVFQTTVEVFDGFSEGWGASKGDLLANTAGTVSAGLQCYFWGKPKIPFRVTFHQSGFAPIRPDLLGSNLPERWLKDYNGQTYWLDFNPERMEIRPRWWPRWLGVNLGYGAEGMIGGDDNIFTDKNGTIQDYSHIHRYRQYYLGPSVSFGYLKNHKSPWIRAIAFVSDRIRIPLPAFEFSRKNMGRFEMFYW